MRGRFTPLAIVLGLMLMLTGCQVELYHGLTEGEANLMLAALLERGVPADKAAAGKNGYTISVPEEDVPRSLEILKVQGLPRENFQSLGQVFSGGGMVSSPVEEQSRLAFALSQELADTFSRIDGVLTSRAHVVLPQYDAASGRSTPPSAAVFLRHTPDSPVVSMIPKIKETSAKAVPGLDYEKVSVMLVPVREDVIPPAGGSAGFVEKHRLSIIIGAAVLAALALAAVILRRKGWRLTRPDGGEGAKGSER
ncbi:EscJ/YscJ/HrcJ family type III secretion inner membrane ring protein [Deltaproteobacteria bacterium Smac51]|nr:EscJ/YscJ/HrcJ family type III secretion inner membrane ring protein [Deltaproteobacteria bacterium Smac51]